MESKQEVGISEMYAEQYEHVGTLEHLSAFAGMRFRHFYPHPMGVSMCGADMSKVYRVRVEHDDNVSVRDRYWGWWDFKDGRWTLVYGSQIQLQVCFTYGHAIEEKSGRGRLLPVKVTPLEKVEGLHGWEEK